ncbi:LamG-like jellyroll fold domain-containing protein [Marinoscillum sp.]|uniref:LamG-like jellyroll fold domain-containing protein n=1 Tax=Marinoscillum sp. TaxID=2024838 RepID=UPI003BAA1400
MKFVFTFFLFGWSSFIAIQAQDTLFVSQHATAGGDGQSWQTAYNQLQDALQAAEQGDQVWVAQGTYFPDEGTNQTDDDRESTFLLKYGVDLYGGFSGVENSLSERDWKRNPTILNGDLDQNDRYNGEVVGIPTGKNAYHVLSILDSASQRLDGLVITGGAAEGADNESRGGGIYLLSRTSVFTLAMKNLEVTGNISEQFGAGLGSTQTTGGWGQLDVTIENAKIHNNRSFQSPSSSIDPYPGTGGGVGIFVITTNNNRVQFFNCDISNNKAKNDGGGVWAYAGGDGVLRLDFMNCLIADNEAFSEVGHVEEQGAGVYAFADNGFTGVNEFTGIIHANLVNCSVVNNLCGAGTSSQGSGIYFDSEPISGVVHELSNTIVHGNRETNGDSDDQVVSFSRAFRSRNCIFEALDAGWGVENVSGNQIGNPQLNLDHYPEPGSIAIDNGNANLVIQDYLDIDQDGETVEKYPYDLVDNDRIRGSQPDVGAFEYDSLFSQLQNVRFYANSDTHSVDLFWSYRHDTSITQQELYKWSEGEWVEVLNQVNAPNTALDTSFMDDQITSGFSYTYQLVFTDSLGRQYTKLETTIPNSSFDHAAVFDGTGTIEIPQHPLLRPKQGTIEFWLKLDEYPTGPNQFYSIASCHDQESKRGWNFIHNTSELMLVMRTQTETYRMQTGINLVDGIWHHLAYAYDATGSQSSVLYVDGEAVAWQQLPDMDIAWMPLRIGSSLDDYWTSLSGGVDEFRLWNYQKTAEQINDLILKRSGGGDQGLNLLLNLDEGDLSYTINDGSPNNLNGHVNGNITSVSSNIALLGPEVYGHALNNEVRLVWGLRNYDYISALKVFRSINGGVKEELAHLADFRRDSVNIYVDHDVVNGDQYNYAVYAIGYDNKQYLVGEEQLVPNQGLGNFIDFDGDDDYIEIKDGPHLRSPVGTIEFWMRIDESPAGKNNGYYMIANKLNDTGNSGWSFYHNTTEFAAQMKNASGAQINVNSGLNLVDGQWHHIAMAYHFEVNQSIRLYVDGQLIRLEDASQIDITDNPVLIGKGQGAFWTDFDGQIDEFRIWNYFRSPQEIQNASNQRANGLSAELMLVLNMDEPKGAVEVDDNTFYDLEGHVFGDVTFSQDNTRSPYIIYSMLPDISLAEVASIDSVIIPEMSATSLEFSPDGLHVYTIGKGLTQGVYHYNLSRAYELNSFNQTGFLDLSVQSDALDGFHMTADGSRLYIIESTTDSIFQYDLSIPFDISTASYNGSSFYVGNQLTEPTDLFINPTGDHLLVSGSDRIYRYALSTAFDVSSVSYLGVVTFAAIENSLSDFTFTKDGKRLFLVGSSSHQITQLDVSESFDITLPVGDQPTWDVSSELIKPTGIALGNSDQELFLVGSNNNKLYSFTAGLSDFEEISADDGSVEGSLMLEIVGDTFNQAGGQLSHGVDYTIINLPDGLHPVLEVAPSAKIGKLSLTGSATSSRAIDSVDELVLQFENSAFTGGNTIEVDATRNQIGIHLGVPYVWNGNHWLGGSAPGTGDEAVINGEYTTITDGVLDIYTLKVNEGARLEIDSATTVTINDALYNEGAVIVRSGGSLITKGNVYGTDYRFERNTTFDNKTGRYSIVGSPVQSAPFDVLTSSHVYGYDETQTYNAGGNEGADRFKTPSQLGHATMVPGQGYFSAFTGDVNGKVIFTGKPNNGTIGVGLSYTEQGDVAETDYQGFHLVSNPYPSSISYTNFMSENSAANITGSIYLWDDYGSDTGRGTNADYLIVNAMGNTDSRGDGLTKWDGYIRSGQGFLVQANSETCISFTNNMRQIGNNSDGGYYRLAAITSYKLILTDGEISKATVLGYASDATLGTDKSYDALNMNGGSLQFYTLQVDSEKKLGIQGLPTTYKEGVKLGYSVREAGKLMIRLQEEGSGSMILYDKLVDQEVDLSHGSYIFSSEAGVFNDRFMLIAPQMVTGLEDLNEIHTYASDGYLHLLSEQPIKAGSQYQLIDLMGRSLIQGTLGRDSNEVDIQLGNLPKSVYILQLIGDNKVWRGKVILK